MLPLATFAQKSGATGNTFKYKHPHSKKPTNYINSFKGTVMLGTSSYYGDLCDSWSDCGKTSNLALGIGVQYRWTRHIATRLDLNYMRLSADDADGGAHPTRNLSFKSDNFDINIIGVYDIFPYIKMFRRRHAFAPYLLGGIGLLNYNPKGEYDGTWYKLRPIETEQTSYSSFAFNIPFGAGIRYKFSTHLDINFEFTYHITFTDFIDDVSNKYPEVYTSDLQQNLSDKRTVETTSLTRGGSETNDSYFVFGFRAEYTLKVPRQHYNLHSKNAKYRTHKGIRR